MHRWFREALEGTGRADDKALAAVVDAALKKRGQDIPLPSGSGEKSSLEKAVSDLKKEPYNPNVVTNFWQTLIASSIEASRANSTVPIVPQLDWTEKDIKDELKNGRSPVYKAGLSHQDLGEIFPKMQSWAVQPGNSITDENKTACWVTTEMALGAPYGNTTEDDLKKRFAKEGRNGVTLETYILASQASKILTGSYFDEGASWSRLPGSRHEGQVVHARFHSDGDLYVYSHLLPEGHYPSFGGRSEGGK